jgi:hypothetical protein
MRHPVRPPVVVAVESDLVTTTHHLVRDREVTAQLIRQYEKGRMSSRYVESVENGRRSVLIWTVVERYDGLPARGDALHTIMAPPAAGAARMPFVQSLARGLRNKRPNPVGVVKR